MKIDNRHLFVNAAGQLAGFVLLMTDRLRPALLFVGGHYSDQQWGCSKAVSIGFVLIVGNGY